MNYLPLVCTLVGIAGVLFSIITASMVKNSPAGDGKMIEIADAIKTGAIAYLNRQLKSMGLAAVVLFVLIAFTLGIKTGIGFLVGAVASFMAGYIGMRVSVIANVRTAEAAKGGLAKALSMAFRGGAVTGMIVAGLALTAVAGFYTILVHRHTGSGSGYRPGGPGFWRQPDFHFCPSRRWHLHQGGRCRRRPGR